MNKNWEYLKKTPNPLRRKYFQLNFFWIDCVKSCMKSFSVEERVTTWERVLWTPGHIFQLSYHAMSTCKQYF